MNSAEGGASPGPIAASAQRSASPLDRLRALTWQHQQPLIAAAALAVTVIPIFVDGATYGPSAWIGALCTIAGAASLALWRRHPIPVLLAGPALLAVCAFTGPDPNNSLLSALVAFAALAAERFSGRAAWVAGLGCAAYVIGLSVLSGGGVGLYVLVTPGFLAGTVLRLRRETAQELAQRGRELEAERELFAELSVRNERARIASELHDIVGHALSVMVVQAAAGQRLAAQAPEAAAASLSVIAGSARQGQAELQRLIDLLAGTQVAGPDLWLIDDVVNQAARSGLLVTCRLEGTRDGLRVEAAHAAFRVVQESLTNALKHAPGAEVRVLVRGDGGGRGVTVLVENGPAPEFAKTCVTGTPLTGTALAGTGRGLPGLRERVLALGGSFAAGPAPLRGWQVQAYVPG